MSGLNERAAEITDAENKLLWERTPGSKALFERATKTMPQGVPSSFQAWDPYPVYLREGKGSHVWDVDGNEYADFHNGFGSMVVGHAHP
jgi:glutamate-1-semialdehyde 2,1-aminomutase